MWLNPSDVQHLGAFFFKALRQILKYKSTLIDRTKTNAFLLQEANRRLNLGITRGPRKVLSKFSVQWHTRRRTLLLHVMRSLPDQPMRRYTFHDGSVLPLLPPRNRVGRPRVDWVLAGMEDLWERSAAVGRPVALGPRYDLRSLEHADWLLTYTLSRPSVT